MPLWPLSCSLIAPVCTQLGPELDNNAFFIKGFPTPLSNAGVLNFKALDSSPNWAALDQGAKDILMLLLHNQPEHRLTAAQLLHDPWLYEAQQKPFPIQRILTPPIAEVSDYITHGIQGRGRQCLPVFKNTCGADMDTHAEQPQHYMARHRGEPQVVQQAEAVQRGLAPCGAAFSSCTSGSASERSPSSLGDISSSAESALHHPLRPVPKPAAMVFVEAAFHQHGTAVYGPHGSADFASSAVCLAPVQPDSSSAQAYQPAHMQAPFETSGTARQRKSLDPSESQSEALSMPASEASTGSASVPESGSLHSGSDYSTSGDDSSSESFSGSGHLSIPSDIDSHSNSTKDLDLATLPSLTRSRDEVSHESASKLYRYPIELISPTFYYARICTKLLYLKSISEGGLQLTLCAVAEM